MLRNKEFTIFILISAILSASTCVIIWFISPLAAIIAVVVLIILNVGYYTFSRYRYGQIKRLSGYLQQVYSGARVLDIRENTEGELSILKNDIYKITIALQEKSDMLIDEKAFLAASLGDISHQLKTPLTGAIITADLLQTHNLSQEKTAEFSQKISSLLEKLSYLVATLLKLSQLDAAAISFAKKEVSVKSLINNAKEPLLVSAELKNIDIRCNITSDCTWQGDEYWTAQAISNVIKNCVEHSPQNSVINISTQDSALYTKIIISDNGGGIDDSDLPHIFKRFYKGKHASADSVGIGLALAKSVLEKQDSAIDVANAKGGAVFTIYLNKIVV